MKGSERHSLGVTGWLQTTDTFWGSEWLEETHEALAYASLLLVGLHLMMLGDKVIEGSGSPRGVWVGVIGVPLSAVAVYLTAAALAWNAHGYRFCYPIAALVVGSLLAVGLSALADRIVRGS